jgi:hypothetical protein
MQKGTHHTQEARTRISITKSLQADIARKALVLKADPTNVEKQMALAEALEAFDLHKNTATGAIESALARTSNRQLPAAQAAIESIAKGRDLAKATESHAPRKRLNMDYPNPGKKDIFRP